MEIISLIPPFFEAQRSNRPGLYHNSFPDFFTHYRHFWSRGKAIPILSDDEINQKTIRFLQQLTSVEQLLEKESIDLSTISVLLMIGEYGVNGHAFIHEGKSIAWFALESFSNERSMQVFIAHEITHALYYELHPDSYFTTKEEQRAISRLLIVEGLATYLSMKILQTDEAMALWADTLEPHHLSDWMSNCASQWSELCHSVYTDFTDTGTTNKLFWAADPTSIFSFRAGYYVGLEFIRWFAETNALTPAQLLHTPYTTLLEAAKQYLQQNSNR